jgi:hypothetical protein
MVTNMKELRGRIISTRLVTLLVVVGLALLSLISMTNLISHPSVFIGGEGQSLNTTRQSLTWTHSLTPLRQPVQGGQKNVSCIFVLQRSTTLIVRPPSTGCGNSPNTIKIGSSLPIGYTHADVMDFMWNRVPTLQ